MIPILGPNRAALSTDQQATRMSAILHRCCCSGPVVFKAPKLKLGGSESHLCISFGAHTGLGTCYKNNRGYTRSRDAFLPWSAGRGAPWRFSPKSSSQQARGSSGRPGGGLRHKVVRKNSSNSVMQPRSKKVPPTPRVSAETLLGWSSQVPDPI